MSGSLGFGSINPQYLQMLMAQAQQGGQQNAMQPGSNQPGGMTGQPLNYQGPQIVGQQQQPMGAGQMPQMGMQQPQGPQQSPQTQNAQALQGLGSQLQGVASDYQKWHQAQQASANWQNMAQNAQGQTVPTNMSTTSLAQHQGAVPASGMSGALPGILAFLQQKYGQQ